MKPREFLQFAIEIGRSKQHARIRSATSRAYYAAYHVAAQFLRQLGFQTSRGGAGHGEVRARMAVSGESQLEETSTLLAELQSKRIQADYSLENPVAEQSDVAMNAIAMAQQVFDTIANFSDTKTHAAIAKSIRSRETGLT